MSDNGPRMWERKLVPGTTCPCGLPVRSATGRNIRQQRRPSQIGTPPAAGSRGAGTRRRSRARLRPAVMPLRSAADSVFRALAVLRPAEFAGWMAIFRLSDQRHFFGPIMRITSRGRPHRRIRRPEVIDEIVTCVRASGGPARAVSGWPTRLSGRRSDPATARAPAVRQRNGNFLRPRSRPEQAG
jgi:hypothetical protein